jgi:hypothetical protein
VTLTRRVLVRLPPSLAENVADRLSAHLRARHAGNHRTAACRRRLHLDFDLLVVELAGAQHWRNLPLWFRALALSPTSASSTRSSAACWARAGRPCAFSRASFDGDLDEIAHDLLDIAADIADLGEFGRFDLEERRAGKLGETPRDFGLADAGGSDHQDVFRQHFFAQPVVNCWRRQRLRSAMATARLASAWPTMKRSSSETISRGEKSLMRMTFGHAFSVSIVTLRLV